MASDESAHVGGVSRRNVLAGTAWVAPAVIVASAVPAAAGSGDAPSLTFEAEANRSGSTITYTAVVTLTSPPADAYIDNGFTITVALPKAGGTYRPTPVGWDRVGDVFTRTGGRVTAPGTAELEFAVAWSNASGLNGSVATFVLSGTSGAGAVNPPNATATSK